MKNIFFYAEKILHLLSKYRIRSNIDLRSKKNLVKIRDAEINKIPFMAIVGEKEKSYDAISIRTHNIVNRGALLEFVLMILNEA